MPTLGNIRITNPVLANIAQEWPAQTDTYVCEKLFPKVSSSTQAGSYWKLDSNRDLLRERELRRAPGAKSVEVDWATDSGTYSCTQKSAVLPLPDEIKDNAQHPVLNKSFGHRIADAVLLQNELELVSTLSSDVTTNTRDSTSNSVKWDNDSTDVLDEITTAKETVADYCGAEGNVLVCDAKVFRALRHHAQILDLIKYGGSSRSPAAVTADSLAQVFDLDRILISRAYYNSANDGQDASMSRVWGTTAYVGYVPTAPSIMEIAAGYTFYWNRPGSANGWIVDMYRDEARESDMARAKCDIDMNLVAESAMYKFTNVI